jgi:hypothetical protein
VSWLSIVTLALALTYQVAALRAFGLWGIVGAVRGRRSDHARGVRARIGLRAAAARWGIITSRCRTDPRRHEPLFRSGSGDRDRRAAFVAGFRVDPSGASTRAAGPSRVRGGDAISRAAVRAAARRARDPGRRPPVPDQPHVRGTLRSRACRSHRGRHARGVGGGAWPTWRGSVRTIWSGCRHRPRSSVHPSWNGWRTGARRWSSTSTTRPTSSARAACSADSPRC